MESSIVQDIEDYLAHLQRQHLRHEGFIIGWWAGLAAAALMLIIMRKKA